MPENLWMYRVKPKRVMKTYKEKIRGQFCQGKSLKIELQRFVTYYEKICVKFCQGKYLT